MQDPECQVIIIIIIQHHPYLPGHMCTPCSPL
jgi:hypothetical protein